MTFDRKSIALLLAFSIVSAQAGFGLPLLGKKKTDQNILPTRKLATSQNQLIDKAITREKNVIKTVKERAPLVETYIQNIPPRRQVGLGSGVGPALPEPGRVCSHHRLDTKYAFNDRLLFPTTSVFNRISMHHTDTDNAAAAKKAVSCSAPRELEGGQQYFGLYRQQRVKSLNEPMIGNGLTKGDNDQTSGSQP